VETYNPDLEDLATGLGSSSDGTTSASAVSTKRRNVGGNHYSKRHYQYQTYWDRTKAAWSLVLSEEDQPPMPITGGYRGAFLASKRSEWSLEKSKPLIAACPAGTGNPGGWVRGVDALPRAGRHYWEVRYVQANVPRGKKMEGTFMTGLFSSARDKFEWASGIDHFWGIVGGRWRRNTTTAAVVEGGRVRDLELEDDYDLDDEVLNAAGVVHGQGESVGVLVDMDEGWVGFFREGKAVAAIGQADFPMLEFDWYPCARPFAAGSKAVLDCHCPVPSAALRMSAPGTSYDSDDYPDSEYDSSYESSYASSSSSSGSSSSGSSSSGSSSGSANGSRQTSSAGAGSSAASGGNGTASTFSFVPPSNSSLSVLASQPHMRRSAAPPPQFKHYK